MSSTSEKSWIGRFAYHTSPILLDDEQAFDADKHESRLWNGSSPAAMI
jgi:hypothetical protein